MSGRIAYIKNLSDVEVYKELIKHGFPAGPVVGKYFCHILLRGLF